MPGVYGGFLDKFPLGALMEKGLKLRTGRPMSSATRRTSSALTTRQATPRHPPR